MTDILRKCITCGRTFWPERGWRNMAFCPNCGRVEKLTEVKTTGAAPAPGKFVALSRIEAGRRPRRRGHAIALEEPEISAPPLPPSKQRPALMEEDPPPVQMVLPPLPQMAFNCPACFTLLVIKDPASYDGRAAPCPYCRTVIMPPRIAQASPFTLAVPEDLSLE